jgi:hypothetical protein
VGNDFVRSEQPDADGATQAANFGFRNAGRGAEAAFTQERTNLPSAAKPLGTQAACKM